MKMKADDNKNKTDWGAVGIFIGLIFGLPGSFTLALYYADRQTAEHREAVINELRPYIEKRDGQSGISDDDKVDFLQHVGIEDGLYTQGQIVKYVYRNDGYDRYRAFLKIQGSGEILIRSQRTDTLERVLRMYKKEETTKK